MRTQKFIPNGQLTAKHRCTNILPRRNILFCRNYHSSFIWIFLTRRAQKCTQFGFFVNSYTCTLSCRPNLQTDKKKRHCFHCYTLIILLSTSTIKSPPEGELPWCDKRESQPILEERELTGKIKFRRWRKEEWIWASSLHIEPVNQQVDLCQIRMF